MHDYAWHGDTDVENVKIAGTYISFVAFIFSPIHRKQSFACYGDHKLFFCCKKSPNHITLTFSLMLDVGVVYPH